MDRNPYFIKGQKPYVDSSNPVRPTQLDPFRDVLGIRNPRDPNPALNPLPGYQSSLISGSGPEAFVNRFRFQDTNRTGIAENDLAQRTFNQIADKFGANAAWTWMMQNAWNQLGGFGAGGMRGIMQNAGISPQDENRLINTYGSSKAKYFEGLKADSGWQGGFFNPNPDAANILKDWNDYRKQQTANYSNPNWKYQAPTTPVVPTTPTPPPASGPTQGNVPGTQSATNFYGHNPYAYTNLPNNPYSVSGVTGGTTTTTSKPVGDTSINTNVVTGVQ